MDARFDADRFEIVQLIRPMANLYRITAGGRDVAFVRQKRLALKEDIRFFADEGEDEELFRLKARRMIDVGGRYDVTGPHGEPIGALERLLGASLLRTTWRLRNELDEEVAVAEERNVLVAVARRVVDLPFLYHFAIRSGDTPVGGLDRKLSLRDRYELDLAGDPGRRIDRRLALALAIALDALQSR